MMIVLAARVLGLVETVRGQPGLSGVLRAALHRHAEPSLFGLHSAVGFAPSDSPVKMDTAVSQVYTQLR